MGKLFRFNFTKETAVAFYAGAGMIFLSLIMLLFSGDSFFDVAISFVLRDLLMIFGLGIVFVSLYIRQKEESVKAIGFTSFLQGSCTALSAIWILIIKRRKRNVV